MKASDTDVDTAHHKSAHHLLNDEMKQASMISSAHQQYAFDKFRALISYEQNTTCRQKQTNVEQQVREHDTTEEPLCPVQIAIEIADWNTSEYYYCKVMSNI